MARRFLRVIGLLLMAGCWSPSTSEGNQPPVIGVMAASPNQGVTPGQPVTVSVGVTDPDGDPVELAWQATGGTISAAAGALVVWTPPVEPGRYGLQVLATDGHGGGTTGTLFATVTPAGVSISSPVVIRPAPVPSPSPSPSPTPSAVPTELASPL